MWINCACDNWNKKVIDEYVQFLYIPIINRIMEMIGI